MSLKCPMYYKICQPYTNLEINTTKLNDRIEEYHTKTHIITVYHGELLNNIPEIEPDLINSGFLLTINKESELFLENISYNIIMQNKNTKKISMKLNNITACQRHYIINKLLDNHFDINPKDDPDFKYYDEIIKAHDMLKKMPDDYDDTLICRIYYNLDKDDIGCDAIINYYEKINELYNLKINETKILNYKGQIIDKNNNVIYNTSITLNKHDLNRHDSKIQIGIKELAPLINQLKNYALTLNK